MFFLANVGDKCTLLWQTFALEISQLSHHENRDIASLVNFQCNAILWFYLVPSSMTSPHTIILTLRKQRNLSDYTQRETYTSTPAFAGTVYKLHYPLLMTVDCGGNVLKRYDEGSVHKCFYFGFFVSPVAFKVNNPQRLHTVQKKKKNLRKFFLSPRF